MINDLIDAISIKLNKVFGDGYEIHTKDIKQGLEEPCFFIKALNPNQNQMIGERYFRKNPFDIHYFPKEEGDNEEINEVAEKLFDAMEYIQLLNGDLVRGTKMHYETIDNVLHFFVEFNVFVRKEKAIDKMEELSVKTDVRR